MERGSAPQGDEKKRFTVMAGGTAEGTMLRPFTIVKNASSGADQTASTVIKKLHDQEGFKEGDGWKLAVWVRELTLNISGKPVTLVYRRNYLIHEATGDVITANEKAWMDSVTMAMWIDTYLGKWASRTAGPKLVIMDNCGPHSVPAVLAVFAEYNIIPAKLPANTTAFLQPMDVQVNSVLKAGLRRSRIRGIFEAFSAYGISAALAMARKEPVPAFNPPRVSLSQGLTALRDVWADALSTPDFRAGLARCFIRCCLWKDSTKSPARYREFLGAGVTALPVPSAIDLDRLATDIELSKRGAGIDSDDDDEDAEKDLREQLQLLLVAEDDLDAPAPAPLLASISGPSSAVLPAASASAVSLTAAAVSADADMPPATSAAPRSREMHRGSVENRVRLHLEVNVPVKWNRYWDPSKKSISARPSRRHELVLLIESLIKEYTRLEAPERAKFWSDKLAAAVAAMDSENQSLASFVLE